MKECPNFRDFNYKHYEAIIKKALEMRYKIVNFREVDEFYDSERLLLLRHDIEEKPERALRIAEVEHSLGVHSTFFVRIHSNDYNPFGFKSIGELKKILSLGHEIGLHYETLELARVLKVDPLALFIQDKSALENSLDIKIESVSEHGDKRTHRTIDHPSEDSMELMERLKQGVICRNSYDPRYFKEMKYLSESNGVWREGCICEHLGEQLKIQLLTHPHLWYEKHHLIG